MRLNPPDRSSGDLRWRSMTDVEREREYSPSSCLPDGDYRPFVAEYRRASDETWARLASSSSVDTVTIPYGDAASQTIDVAVPLGLGSAPLLVYFHGGYWQELSRLDSRFAAWDCIQRGWAFAAVDYTLAPAADLGTIVAECRQSLRTLLRHAGPLRFDPSQMFVAGSSAGAHLAAMVATDPDRPNPSVRGAVLISGIFALEPLIGTSVNEAVRLDMSTAVENSPMHAPLDDFPPSLLVYGDNETSEFKAQSRAFAERLRQTGHRSTVLEITGRNHFDVVLDLAAPGTTLGHAVADFVNSTRENHAHL